MPKRVLVTGGSGFIGTQLVSDLLSGGYTVTNFDIKPPLVAEHAPVWQRGDILDRASLRNVVELAQPEIVVHLAARTDTEGRSIDDYVVNTTGTENLLSTMRDAGGVRRLIAASSQYVMQPGPMPETDTDFNPLTVYGASKVITEQLVREARLQFPWTIVRPTNVWGPWHPRYPQEFWKVLERGRYVHPGRKPVFRCYSYVGNLTYQLLKIITSDESAIGGQVFYLSDPPIDVWEWADAFSLAITGEHVRRVPRPVVRSLALIGDAVIRMGGRFPIYSSRYESMTTDYLTPLDKTFLVLGRGPHSLEEGVRLTVDWLRAHLPAAKNG